MTAPTRFADAPAFARWLPQHHDRSDGLWLMIAKRGAREPSVTCAEAVEIALCWGWIDGQKQGLDDQHCLHRFTPRRARRHPAQAQVAAAQAFFATVNASKRYAVLWRIQTAVKPETRARRIAQRVAMRARGEVVHLVKPKGKGAGRGAGQA